MTHGEDRSSREMKITKRTTKEEALKRIEFPTMDPKFAKGMAMGFGGRTICDFCDRNDIDKVVILMLGRREDVNRPYVGLCDVCLLRPRKELANVARRFKKDREPSEASFFSLFGAIDSLAEINGFGEACRSLGISGEADNTFGRLLPFPRR